MHKLTSLDVHISVWPQIREVAANIAPLYEGIYGVILNRILTVMFVPYFERQASIWPPVIPDNIDDIRTFEEARRISVAMSAYVVTPDPVRAGEVETISAFAPQLRDGVIFYVYPAEFDLFQRELHTVALDTPGNSSSIELANVRDYEFTQFLLTNVLASDYFSEEDARQLSGGSK